MPGILAVVLPQRGKLNSSTYELMSAGRDLAGKCGEPFWAAVLGAQASGLAQELVERGADKVFVLEHPSFENLLDDSFAGALAALAGAEKPSKILFASTVAGRSTAARLSVNLKAGVAADVSEFLSAGAGSLKARRTWYSGNLFAEVEIKSPTAVVTIQGLAWPQAERQPGRAGEIVKTAVQPAPSRIEFSSFQAEESNEIDLATAERVVSGGRGLGSAEGFNAVRDLAHAIKAAVGASRAVVDSGWIAYRHQVGLTGRAVRPKLYVACGISGQIQHLAGMSASPNIVAINTDPDCPMMKVASISVVGDLLELLPLVTAEIKKRKGVPVAA